MLHILDYFFTFLHLLFTAFNLVGWIWPSTRKLHLITMALTTASWFILGIWYGWGYCFLTDWQWSIKTKLGESHLPGSFIKYFADKVTGRDIDPNVVNIVTLICFVIALLLTIYVNFIKKKTSGQTK
jgi:hypothetical protein